MLTDLRPLDQRTENLPKKNDHSVTDSLKKLTRVQYTRWSHELEPVENQTFLPYRLRVFTSYGGVTKYLHLLYH